LLLGNCLSGGDFLIDDDISKCLVLMARQRALASSLATDKWCWDGIPFPVSRERSPRMDCTCSCWMLTLHLQSSHIGKPGREVSLSLPRGQLSSCRQAWDYRSEQGMGCFSRISSSWLSRQGKSSGHIESGETFCSRLWRLLLCAQIFPPPSLGRDILTHRHFQLLWAPLGAASSTPVLLVKELGPEL